MHAIYALAAFVATADTPFDYSAAAATVGTVLGGLGAGLLAVLAAALGVRAFRWGVPKIIGFFSRIS